MCKRAFETVSPKNYTCPAAEMGRTPIWGVRLWEEAGAHRLAVAACRWSTPANPSFRFRFSATPPLLPARKGASAAKNCMAVAARPSSAPPPLLPPVTRMSGTNFARHSVLSEPRDHLPPAFQSLCGRRYVKPAKASHCVEVRVRPWSNPMSRTRVLLGAYEKAQRLPTALLRRNG